jgi:type I restriction enzyme R subunit
MTMNLGAALGVAIREYPMDTGPLFVDRQPVGVIEAKAGPTILTFIEDQTARYAVSQLKWRVEQKPLSFLFESTGQVTRFADGRDPGSAFTRGFSVFFDRKRSRHG